MSRTRPHPLLGVPALVLITLALAAMSAPAYSTTTIRVGVIFAAPATEVSVAASELALNEVNADPAMPAGFRLEAVYNFTSYSRTVAMKNAMWQMLDHKVVALLGPKFSVEATAVSYLASTLEVPMLSHTATAAALSDKSEHPFFQRMMPVDTNQIDILKAICRRFGWKNIVIAHTDDEYGRGFADAFVRSSGAYDTTQELRAIPISMPSDQTAPTAAAGYATTAARIKELDVRVVFLHCVSQQQAITEALEAAGLTRGEFVFIVNNDAAADYSSSTDSFKAMVRKSMRGFLKVASVFPKMSNPKCASLVSALTAAVPNTPVTGRVLLIATYAYDAMWVLGRALHNLTATATSAADYTGAKLRNQLRRTTFAGASGQVAFDAKGNPIADFEVLYMPEGQLTFTKVMEVNPRDRVITPVGSAEIVWADGTRNVPVDVRPTRLLGLSSGITAGAMVLVAVGAVVSLAFHALVHVNREHKIILASSVIFCHLILFGTLLSLAAVAIETLVDRAQAWHCITVPWMLSAGFALTFGSLLAKTWRLSKIFGTAKLRVVKITNRDLLLFIGALLLVDAVIVAIWAGVDTPTMVITADPVRDYVNVQRCSMDHKVVWYALLIAPKLAMLVYSARLAYLVRNLDSNFRESSQIAASIYVMLFFGAITVPVLILVQKQIDVAHVLLSVGVCLAMINITAALFGPKFYNLYISEEWKNAANGTGATTGGGATTASGIASFKAVKSGETSTSHRNGSFSVSETDTVSKVNDGGVRSVTAKHAPGTISLSALPPVRGLQERTATVTSNGGADRTVRALESPRPSTIGLPTLGVIRPVTPTAAASDDSSSVPADGDDTASVQPASPSQMEAVEHV